MLFLTCWRNPFWEQHNNQGRQLENGPEKECMPDNREKQCEEVGKSKEEGRGSTTHRNLESGQT
jgi:hypothetical protein